MNTQEVFDKVVLHLRTQNKKATNGSSCQYLTANGLKCAIGCLIEDHEFSEIAPYDVSTMLCTAPDSVRERLLPHKYILGHLQLCHDRFEVNQWETRLEQIAKDFNLVWTPKPLRLL
jgi:hypothetical protein